MTTRLEEPLAIHGVCGRYGGLVVTGTCENGGAPLDDLEDEADADDDWLPVQTG